MKGKDRLASIRTNYSLLEIPGIPSDLRTLASEATSNHRGVSDLQDPFPEELQVHIAPDSAKLSEESVSRDVRNDLG